MMMMMMGREGKGSATKRSLCGVNGLFTRPFMEVFLPFVSGSLNFCKCVSYSDVFVSCSGHTVQQHWIFEQFGEAVCKPSFHLWCQTFLFRFVEQPKIYNSAKLRKTETQKLQESWVCVVSPNILQDFLSHEFVFVVTCILMMARHRKQETGNRKPEGHSDATGEASVAQCSRLNLIYLLFSHMFYSEKTVSSGTVMFTHLPALCVPGRFH